MTIWICPRCGRPTGTKSENRGYFQCLECKTIIDTWETKTIEPIYAEGNVVHIDNEKGSWEVIRHPDQSVSINGKFPTLQL